MTRSLLPFAATALIACHRSDDNRTSTTAIASASSAVHCSSSSSSGCDEPSVAERRAPEVPETSDDAGVREGSKTRVVCGRNAHRNCLFHGRVRAVRAAVLEPGEPPNKQVYFPERSNEVVLEDVSSLACYNIQLRGVQQGYDGDGGRDGPRFGFVGEIPVTRELMITLSPGLRLPFTEGELICGSVMSYALSDIYAVGREALIARPNGDVLLAYASAMMPRDPSPAPGWTFTLGPRRTSRSPLNDHDMFVTHGGVSVRTAFTREPALLRAPDGEYLISAEGYVTVGHLSGLETHLAKQGYFFTIVRVGEVTGSELRDAGW